jgi:calcineurin-like phosphoesterase family protein
MSSVFITSDEHFEHGPRRDTGVGGIIKLTKRPFGSLEEMRETIIERHNKVVPPGRGSLVIHAGDWFWHTMPLAEALWILDRLHGRHAFIFGNHDELIERERKIFAERLDWIVGRNEVSGAEIVRFNKHKLYVTHYAQRVWPGSHKGHWHVYGHSHNGLPGLGKSFDIGVDGHDFYPWSMEEIEARMDTLPQHHTIDNTGRPDEKDNVREGR